MSRKLRQSDTVVTRLNLPFAELPDRRNDFAAGVVCNLAAYRRGGNRRRAEPDSSRLATSPHSGC